MITGDGARCARPPNQRQRWLGFETLQPYLGVGQTVALLGSSGVGKSSIVNRLVGELVLPTRSVRESDSRGRHASVHRQMIALPGGGLVIDTPGMRELQLWGVDEGPLRIVRRRGGDRRGVPLSRLPSWQGTGLRGEGGGGGRHAGRGSLSRTSSSCRPNARRSSAGRTNGRCSSKSGPASWAPRR